MDEMISLVCLINVQIVWKVSISYGVCQPIDITADAEAEDTCTDIDIIKLKRQGANDMATETKGWEEKERNRG